MEAGFLVDTGTDTLAVTRKHIFNVFAIHRLLSVDFQERLQSWTMYPKNQRNEKIVLGELVNRNPDEFASLPNSVNNADWLVFKIKENNSQVQAFKIRENPIDIGEILFIMNSTESENLSHVGLVQCRVFRTLDNQILLELFIDPEDPEGMKGAPIFDKNGLLVGIFSSLTDGVSRGCSVNYLIETLTKNDLIAD